MSESTVYETVIVGGGPAGLACALELIESRVQCLLLERAAQLAPQVREIHNPLENFPVGPFANGINMQTSMIAAVQTAGCFYQLGCEAAQIDCARRVIETPKGTVRAKTILLATGYRVRRLNLAGEDNYGDNVCYHVRSGSSRFAGQPVAVVGGGDNAFIHAIELAELSSQVYLISRSPKFKARPDLVAKLNEYRNIELLNNSQVVELSGQKDLRAIKVRSSVSNEITTLPVRGLLVKIGYQPNTELVAGQLETDQCGHIAIDERCRTSQTGIYAAGDITTPGYPRIATALGQGAIAACAIRSYLGK